MAHLSLAAILSRETDAESIGRGYNYPHVVAAYWSMYRLGRNHNGPVTNHAWNWYLDQAYETIRFMFSRSRTGGAVLVTWTSA